MKALIDGSTTAVPLQAIPFKRFQFTKYEVKILHFTSTRVVRKALVATDIETKYKETAALMKIVAKEKRKTMNDLDRFKLCKTKKTINNLVKREVARLRYQAKKKASK
ncbi:RPL14 [Cordylochernes scorpioides]|uniref:Large ribosomal subunit protein eL14 n=1 Tax=Cordylochernes scorpioides TaxID=51811 RepID=A0ABY6KXI5_9ARAC|nr:RPL14 [Cordylochernes scorpioides]